MKTILARVLLIGSLAATSSAAADWPHYLGPHGNNSAEAFTGPLVDRFADARLVWESHTAVPDAMCGDSRRASRDGRYVVSGGYGSPIVAAGRVYLQYYVPSGEIAAEEVVAKFGGASRPKFLVEADDVIHCFDAASGKTLWRKVYPRTAMNMQAFTKGGPSLTPCVADGRLYFHSNGGRVFCLDAASGEHLWEARTERFEFQEKMRQLAREKKVLAVYNRDFKTSPRVIDGVVLFNDHRHHKTMPVKPGGRAGGGGWEYHYDKPSNLVALDAATGKQLWKLPDGLSNSASPLSWTHDGKAYLIAAGSAAIRCIEPRSGKVLWDLPAAGDRTPCVCDDYLVIRGAATPAEGAAPPARAPAVHVGYRLALDGPTRLWELPVEYGCPVHATPTAANGFMYTETVPRGRLICVELATGKVVGTAPAEKEAHFGYFPTLMGDRLVCGGGDTDQLHLYAADPKDFRLLDDVLMPNASGYETPILPALADGRMYLRTHDRLICVDLRPNASAGKRLGDTPLMSAISKGHYRLTFTAEGGTEAITATMAFIGKQATDGPTVGEKPVPAIGWGLTRRGLSGNHQPVPQKASVLHLIMRTTSLLPDRAPLRVHL